MNGGSTIMLQRVNVETNPSFRVSFEGFDVKVVIDPKSLTILDGTQIDYISEGLNQTFKFSNPRSTSECGCGESFALNS